MANEGNVFVYIVLPFPLPAPLFSLSVSFQYIGYALKFVIHNSTECMGRGCLVIWKLFPIYK